MQHYVRLEKNGRKWGKLILQKLIQQNITLLFEFSMAIILVSHNQGFDYMSF
jgi:hypothetical protein